MYTLKEESNNRAKLQEEKRRRLVSFVPVRRKAKKGGKGAKIWNKQKRGGAFVSPKRYTMNKNIAPLEARRCVLCSGGCFFVGYAVEFKGVTDSTK